MALEAKVPNRLAMEVKRTQNGAKKVDRLAIRKAFASDDFRDHHDQSREIACRRAMIVIGRWSLLFYVEKKG